MPVGMAASASAAAMAASALAAKEAAIVAALFHASLAMETVAKATLAPQSRCQRHILQTPCFHPCLHLLRKTNYWISQRA